MLTKSIEEQNLIEILGLENTPLEKQEQIIVVATEIIEARAIDKILEKLNDEETDQFIKLIEEQDEVNTANFFKEKEIDILDILKKETSKFKEEMVEK